MKAADARRLVRAHGLEGHVKQIVEGAPPLTRSQTDALRRLLNGERETADPKAGRSTASTSPRTTDGHGSP